MIEFTSLYNATTDISFRIRPTVSAAAALPNTDLVQETRRRRMDCHKRGQRHLPVEGATCSRVSESECLLSAAATIRGRKAHQLSTQPFNNHNNNKPMSSSLDINNKKLAASISSSTAASTQTSKCVFKSSRVYRRSTVFLATIAIICIHADGKK